MSELTRCNRCKLEDMKRRAAARGVTVDVQVVFDPHDPMHGWTSARYSDQDKPSSYYQVLTEACAC